MKKIKRLLKIITGFFLVIFLFGNHLLDYYSFLSENQTGITFDISKVQDKLIVKVPFVIPYNNVFDFDILPEDILVHEGQFFRAESKVALNDTLTTIYRLEVLTRQNMFEMLGIVAGQVEKETHNNPFRALNKLIKNFSKNFYSPEYSYTVYFWNEPHHHSLKILSTDFCSFQTDVPNPPPNV
ncbi:MAG: hypothetical protein U0V04_16750 [Spirosomataceae bacterium]